MKKLTVEMGDYNIAGTGLQGYFPPDTKYSDIIKVFGNPNKPASLDDKVKACWAGKINGNIFTIYDYKSGCKPELNTDWHIGGKKKVEKDVIQYFQMNK